MNVLTVKPSELLFRSHLEIEHEPRCWVNEFSEFEDCLL